MKPIHSHLLVLLIEKKKQTMLQLNKKNIEIICNFIYEERELFCWFCRIMQERLTD